MLNKIVTFILVISVASSFAQKVEFDKIHWENDDRLVRKMHVKEMIPFNDKSANEVHDLVENWFTTTFLDKRKVFTYRIELSNGQLGWFADKDRPFYINQADRLWTRSVKCKNCFLVRYNRRKDEWDDGYFQMDIRIKEGEALLVVTNYYSELLNNYLANVTQSETPATDREKKYFRALEVQFAKVKTSLIEFSSDVKSIDN